ncbi:MAG: cisplatin damage response ATP-dependent DNA ligase [Rhizobiales bacterium]|nr:cisplatin damage response ATP-dependent DNA ligase [Hyphomicrobiales bacterium]MBO6699153.1 cisplatin damage response ATP-dependent DNA ligase [Hyphomicrobiales bacterium]MBO6736691.1 cisplatin damage response ATP-dependent DNA ligase [Hyphomicrobiales bacterium]MBO6912235.1 cisplatin damage response ATP-dependent DNA ligase [Hyphomicrobiales bacterium]MBO6956238.1 cisplatin damage response ATP-dependent DNA ligase [Hyphomicrobiales bacterium]
MKAFAELLDRLAYEPRRNGKLRMLVQYFSATPDPERGLALAAITGGLDFKNAKPALIRGLVEARTDPVLFRLSYDYVGDMSETVALLWPADHGINSPPPTLEDVVDALATTGKAEMPALITRWLDTLDETGRWALLKLITGGLRIGVSARLAKTAVAGLGDLKPNDVEEVWHGLLPPYQSLFAWAEGKGERPENDDPAPFAPAMLAHPIEDGDFEKLEASEFLAEWKWDGIRVQAASGMGKDGQLVRRLYSRTGDDISRAFPDLVEALPENATLDGELLVLIDGRVQTFNTLQQRLNRKTVSKKLLESHPAHMRVYDVLRLGGQDLRPLPFVERRSRLQALVDEHDHPRLDLSPMVAFEDWHTLEDARADPASHGAEGDADAVEGVMIKRIDSAYVPGRPKGPWWKWKRDPMLIDAVLMYAQRGHGKRSSLYSDYTFGVWKPGEDGRMLVPVGKAYFGFTDEELKKIDSFVRKYTVNRFGPVREVIHGEDAGMVFEVAFEGLQRSTRHKSGVAMRFPRISRLRWDKPPREADTLETVMALLPESERS